MSTVVFISPELTMSSGRKVVGTHEGALLVTNMRDGKRNLLCGTHSKENCESRCPLTECTFNKRSPARVSDPVLT